MGLIDTYFQKAVKQNQIENELYRRYNVKKGLRNEDGTGVRIGLTRIAVIPTRMRKNAQLTENSYIGDMRSVNWSKTKHIWGLRKSASCCCSDGCLQKRS